MERGWLANTGFHLQILRKAACPYIDIIRNLFCHEAFTLLVIIGKTFLRTRQCDALLHLSFQNHLVFPFLIISFYMQSFFCFCQIALFLLPKRDNLCAPCRIIYKNRLHFLLKVPIQSIKKGNCRTIVHNFLMYPPFSQKPASAVSCHLRLPQSPVYAAPAKARFPTIFLL